MESDVNELTMLHRTQEEHLAAFKVKYILLSKLSKFIKLSSLALIECLESRAIYPIDKKSGLESFIVL